MLKIGEAIEMGVETKTCSACGGWFSQRAIVIAAGQSAVPTAFIHRRCMVDALAEGPPDPVERRFEEIQSQEKLGLGLLAELERDQVGAET